MIFKERFMGTNIYEKNENGYVLRQRNAAIAVVVVMMIFLGLILPLGALVHWVEGEPQTVNGWVIGGISLACFALALTMLRSEWRYLVIDEKGISFHRPLARPKMIPWEEVRDWGLAYQTTRRGWVHYLYFSTERLKVARHGRHKNMPLTYGQTGYISVEQEDLSPLRRSGALSFCRQHLGWNNKSAKNFAPMFTSDLA